MLERLAATVARLEAEMNQLKRRDAVAQSKRRRTGSAAAPRARSAGRAVQVSKFCGRRVFPPIVITLELNHTGVDIMKTNKTNVAGCCAVALLVVLASAPAGAATEGSSNNFFGTGAGASNSGTNFNSFFGGYAGNSTPPVHNTFFGSYAGCVQHHRLLQHLPRSFCRLLQHHRLRQHLPRKFCRLSNTTGSRNVFIGYAAGYNETGSNKLYIDNCYAVLAPPPSSMANSTIICLTSTARSASRLTAPRSRNCISRSMAATWAAGHLGAGQQLLCLLRGSL